MPHTYFLKFTSHEFKKLLLQQGETCLEAYKIKANNKDYEFWQRDTLAVHLYSKEVAFQKLDYLHINLLAEHWQLAASSEEYIYSSAAYYEKEERNFSFLKDLREEF